MKNKQEILGLITNIVLVIFLLCFIVAGLNIIGIYSLPEPIEKLLGTYDGDDNSGVGGDESVYNLTEFDENMPSFESVSIDYENAYEILSNLSSRDSYSQRVRVVHLYAGLRRAEIFGIVKRNGLYTVSVSDESGNLIKKISQDDKNQVTVSELYDENQSPALIDRGNFDISEECGFVLTAREFLESGYELSLADFRQFATADQSFMSVEFDYSFNNQLLRQKYVISLDFGVVTEVYSYENGAVVFEMTTESLSVTE